MIHIQLFLYTKMLDPTFFVAKIYRLAQILFFWKNIKMIQVKSCFFLSKIKYGLGHLFNYKWDLIFLPLKKWLYVNHVMNSRWKMVENLDLNQILSIWFYKDVKLIFLKWMIKKIIWQNVRDILNNFPITDLLLSVTALSCTLSFFFFDTFI